MAAELDEDRGDDAILTGDEGGDTPDLKKKDDEVKTRLDGETEEEAAARELAEAATKAEEAKKAALTIPKARYDEAVKKARDEAAAATKRAAELEEKMKAHEGKLDLEAAEKKLDEWEDKLESAVRDGNAEAKQIARKAIRELNQAIADSRAAGHAARATALAVEQVRYDAVVGVMEAEHPELNPDDDSYDEAKVAEVGELKEAFEAKGEASSTALKKALKLIYPKGAEAPAKEAGADDKAAAAQKLADERIEAARRKADAVKKGQPPDQSKTGLDSDKLGKGKGAGKLEVAKLSDKDFDKLSEEEKAVARGDAV